MAEDLGPREMLLMATAASEYYIRGRSKIEIAEDLGVSRFKVARMLETAISSGMVKIEIKVPDGIDLGLSSELRDAFDLRQAVVIDTPDSPQSDLYASLGRAAARILDEVVTRGDVVGIAWGRTLQAMAAETRHLAKCSIVQMTGALAQGGINDNPIELVRRLSTVSGGPAFPVYAPMILSDASLAEALRGQPNIAEAHFWYDRLTVAVIPVGSWSPPESGLFDALDAVDRSELLAEGVAADTSVVTFNKRGAVVASGLTARTVGISAAQLMRVPEVIAVAGGTQKSEAIRSVLRAGFVTTLITNANVARDLLEHGEAASG